MTEASVKTTKPAIVKRSMLMPLKPRISEKSYGSAEKDNIYIFVVPKNANKQTITSAVESQFNVKVADVRTLNVKGKPKRAVRKRQRPAIGSRKDIKKAYVNLAAGSKINVFGNDDDKKQKVPKTTAAKNEAKTSDNVAKKSGIRKAFNRGPRHTQDKGGGK